METTDKDKLDLIASILPVIEELRRFYEVQFNTGMESLEYVKDPEEHKRFMKFILDESKKTSKRVHGLAGVSWALIDDVCKSLGVAYHEFTAGITDERK